MIIKNAKIYFYLRNKNIYAQIVYNKKRSIAFSTGIKSNCNFDKITQRFENDSIANLKLESLKVSIYNIELKFANSNQILDAETLKSLLIIENFKKKLIEVLTKFISKEKSNKEITTRTLQTYSTRSNGLIKFLSETNNLDILISEVDILFVKKYESWLILKKYKNSYCNKNLQFLNQILFFCTLEKYILNNCMYKYIYLKSDTKSNTNFLKTEELQKIEFKNFENERLNRTKDWFLFQCYTGLSYSDMLIFNPKSNLKIEKELEWIIGYRKNTKSNYQLPLIKQAKTILNKYPNGFEIISNVNYNVYIKEIIAICNINKPNINSSSSRKTFGNYCIEKGCNLQTISEMLGHKDTRLTSRVYVDIRKSKILKDMEVIL